MDPDKRPPKLIERLRTEVERAPGGRLTDKELAAMAIDPSTARRQFKRHYGMTFQAYHRARRMGLALREVRKGGRVDVARNGSGFESAERFSRSVHKNLWRSTDGREVARANVRRANRYASWNDGRSR